MIISQLRVSKALCCSAHSNQQRALLLKNLPLQQK